MPKYIELPGGEVVEFPEEMADSAISAVLAKQFKPKPIPGTEQTGLPGVPPPQVDMQMSAAGADPDAAPKGALRKTADTFDTFMRAGGAAIGGSVRGAGGMIQAIGDHLRSNPGEHGVYDAWRPQPLGQKVRGQEMLGTKTGPMGKAISETLGRNITSVGKEVAAFGKDQQLKAAPRKDFEKLAGADFIDDPAVMHDPEWWAQQFGNVGGSVVSMMVGPRKLAGPMEAAISAANLGAKTASRVRTIANATTGALIETMIDAGNAHQDAIANGASREVAGMVAAEVMKREFPTTAAFNAAGLYNDNIKSVLKRTLTSIPIETAQEVMQGVSRKSAENAALGTNQDVWADAPMDALGGAIGGAMGGAMEGYASSSRAEAPPTVKDSFTVGAQNAAASAMPVPAQAPSASASPKPGAPKTPTQRPAATQSQPQAQPRPQAKPMQQPSEPPPTNWDDFGDQVEPLDEEDAQAIEEQGYQEAVQIGQREGYVSPDLLSEELNLDPVMAEAFADRMEAEGIVGSPDQGGKRPLAVQPAQVRPSQARPAEVQPKMEGQIPAAIKVGQRLPERIKGSKPRYSYGSKQFTLTFEDDFDAAAYITSQKKPSKADHLFVKYAKDTFGVSEKDLREYGQKIRARIKKVAEGAKVPSNGPGNIVIPRYGWIRQRPQKPQPQSKPNPQTSSAESGIRTERPQPPEVRPTQSVQPPEQEIDTQGTAPEEIAPQVEAQPDLQTEEASSEDNGPKAPMPRDRSSAEAKWPEVSKGATVDGRVVRQHISNISSISASFDDYEVLPGIREVSLDDFEQPPRRNARTLALAEEIQRTGEIEPLIVAIDKEGPYILEGSHRYDALKIIGAKSFPALTVVDMSGVAPQEAAQSDLMDAPADKVDIPAETVVAKPAPKTEEVPSLEAKPVAQEKPAEPPAASPGAVKLSQIKQQAQQKKEERKKKLSAARVMREHDTKLLEAAKVKLAASPKPSNPLTGRDPLSILRLSVSQMKSGNLTPAERATLYEFLGTPEEDRIYSKEDLPVDKPAPVGQTGTASSLGRPARPAATLTAQGENIQPEPGPEAANQPKPAQAIKQKPVKGGGGATGPGGDEQASQGQRDPNSRIEVFIKAMREAMAGNMAANPSNYGFGPDRIDEVMERYRKELQTGNVNILSSPSLRSTMKKFGIKLNKKALMEWLSESGSPFASAQAIKAVVDKSIENGETPIAAEESPTQEPKPTRPPLGPIVLTSVQTGQQTVLQGTEEPGYEKQPKPTPRPAETGVQQTPAVAAGEEGNAALEDVPSEDGPKAPEKRPTDRGGRKGGRGGDAADSRPGSESQNAGEQSEGDGSAGTDLPSTRERLTPAPPRKKATNDRDFIITDRTLADLGAKVQRFEANLAAIELAKKITAENREATYNEKEVMARYVGWGGLSQEAFGYAETKPQRDRQERLKELLTTEELAQARSSTQNAHYTSPDVVRGMWDALNRLGLKKEMRILEPAVGTGNFFGLQPQNSLPAWRFASEKDGITATIAKLLYPDSRVYHSPYEKAPFAPNFFDVAISNVPFAKVTIADDAFRKSPYLLSGVHNYFFAKALEHVKPGGVIAFVTSRYTMDAKSSAIREYLASKADLLGAIRLPGGKKGTFADNAGTEVTTDIIFLQRRKPGQDSNGVAWTKTVETEARMEDQDRTGTFQLNEYFAQNPNMMLGEMTLRGSMRREAEPMLEGEFTPEKLAKAIENLPEGVLGKEDDGRAAFAEDAPIAIPETMKGVKDGAFAVIEGKLVMRNGNIFDPVSATPKVAERIRGLIQLREILRSVYKAQLDNLPEESLQATRDALNKAYDAFVAKNGPINSVPNRRAFGEDPDFPVLAAIEDIDSETKEVTKRNVFRERTIPIYTPPANMDNSADALAVVLSEKGYLDVARLQGLTGKSMAQISQELPGKIFFSPEGEYVIAEEYLSGNVREKLRAAELAAETDPVFQTNVEALRQVIPEDLSAEDIDVKPGAPWMDAQDIADFLDKGIAKSRWSESTVEYSPTSATWTLYPSGEVRASVENNSANSDFTLVRLLELSLNSQKPKVYDRDGRIVPKSTIQAEEAQKNLEKKFTEWLWSDEGRKKRLVERYNNTYNAHRLRQFDGSHLTLPGMNKSMLRSGDLDAHQKNAVWRIVASKGNTLLAHVVGAGKTFEMIAAAMEMRRMGIARKPMIVVPNHLVDQWGADVLKLYPAANVFVAGKDTFKSDKRQLAASRIASGDYDIVIVSHSGFGLLPVSDQTFEFFIREELSEINAEIERLQSQRLSGKEKKGKTVKNLEARKARLEARIEKNSKRSQKDKAIDFESLGVDHIFVDEAHEFKNLGFTTSMERVAGLPNSDAQRSFDLYMKSRYLMRKRQGRGLTFATGTPISNTLAEMFTMSRYLDPDTLKDRGIQNFDSWARMFGRAVRSVEVAPEGGKFRMNTRFVEFVNLPELITMFRQFADVKTAKDLNLPKPEIEGGRPTPVKVPGNGLLKAYVRYLGGRAEAIRSGSVEPKDDNMLKVTHEGRMAALDLRLIYDKASRAIPWMEGEVARMERNLAFWASQKFEDAKAQATADRTANQTRKQLAEYKGILEEASKYTNPVAILRESSFKANIVAEEVHRIWKETADQKSTQVVFADLGIPKAQDDTKEDSDTEADWPTNFYEILRDNMIALGIPAAEIRFIHDAKNDDQKKELFDQVNAGQVRVLMGSTAKMGAGTNVQKRLIALHDVDVPWRPSDIEQRHGRIVRQGNSNKTVKIRQYVTEDSFDAYMWQTIGTKAAMIGKAMSGDLTARKIEDVGSMVLSAKELQALATGDPSAQERLDLESKIGRLEAEKESLRNAERQREWQILNLKKLIQNRNAWTERARRDRDLYAAWAKKNEGSESVVVLSGSSKYVKGEELLKFLQEFPAESIPPVEDPFVIGSAGPFPLRIFRDKNRLILDVKLASNVIQIPAVEISVAAVSTGPTLLGQIRRELNSLAPSVTQVEEETTNYQRQLEIAEAQGAGEGFKKQAELDAMKKRFDELSAELGIYEDQAGNESAADATPEESAEPQKAHPVSESRSNQRGFLLIEFRKKRKKRPKNTEPADEETRAKLQKAAQKLDISRSAILKLAARIGIPTGPIGQDDAQLLLTELLVKDPSGLPSGRPKLPMGADYFHSPSAVLGQSRAGAAIYRAAEDSWFDQERMNERFTKNWERINKGTTKEERNDIAIYRFTKQIMERQGPEEAKEWLSSIDEDPDTVDDIENSLDERLKKINDEWTKFFFEPMRKIGVEEGFLEEGQKFNEYLSFYKDESLNPARIRDAAVDLAQEIGVSVSTAQAILEAATPKSIKFGSWDFQRGLMARPEIRDADRIAEIYRRGFARKVAITRFLTAANPLSQRILDPGLRRFARRYINQFAGRPAEGDFLQEALDALPGIRRLGLRAGQVAGVLTAIQFNAKIGGNAWTPVLNLTQTVVNTVPRLGLVRTAKAFPRAAAAILLPRSMNPYYRDLVNLQYGGIYRDDPAQGKFDRPAMHGYAKTAQQALTFLFDKTEGINRATAYLAGLDEAKEKGLKGFAAVRHARAAVRQTQFFSGRLDAPLFARTPVGKVVWQFKSFTFKEIEFVRSLSPAQQGKFVAATVLLGGPATLGILQVLKEFGPEWPVTKLLEEWQEKLSVAGFLHAERLATQLGIWTVPGLDNLSTAQYRNRLLQWAAGPTISAILDSIQGAAQFGKDPKNAEKFLATILRSWAPGGVQLTRVQKAMAKANSPEEAVRILTNTAQSKNKN